MSSPKVLFVGGYGRSGSTLLDMLLSQSDSVVALGEFRHLFGRGMLDGELCSCGVPLPECPWWSGVLGDVLEEFNPTQIQYAVSDLNRLIRYPQFRFKILRTKKFNSSLSIYTAAFEATIKSILDTTGAETLVDSTKYPLHGWVLNEMDLDLQVVNLIRDPRAVAYSWTRKRLRPEIHWEERYMPRYSYFRSALAWILSNHLTQKLPGAEVVRYDNLVGDPNAFIESLGLRPDLEIKNDEILLTPTTTHTVAGNPLRVGTQSIKLKMDTEWQTKASKFGTRIVSLVCYPFGKQHGYFK